MFDVYILDSNGWTLYATIRSENKAMRLVDFIRSNARRAGWFNHNTLQCVFDD